MSQNVTENTYNFSVIILLGFYFFFIFIFFSVLTYNIFFFFVSQNMTDKTYNFSVIILLGFYFFFHLSISLYIQFSLFFPSSYIHIHCILKYFSLTIFLFPSGPFPLYPSYVSCFPKISTPLYCSLQNETRNMSRHAPQASPGRHSVRYTSRSATKHQLIQSFGSKL